MNLLHHPDPRLYTRCPDVPAAEFGPALDAALDEMLVLMRQAHPGHPKGGVGLAAPQVGLMRRAIVMQATPGRAFKMVNPRLVATRDVVDGIEGCLSLISLDVKVARARWIEVAYLDAFGVEQLDTFEDWEARIVQHEIDHLDGITLVSRARRGAKRDFERRYGATPGLHHALATLAA